MSKNWYYEHNDEEAGPMPWSAIENLLDTGFLDVSTKVWRSGWSDWRTIGDVVAQPDHNADAKSSRGSRGRRAQGTSPRQSQGTAVPLNPTVMSAGIILVVIGLATGVWMVVTPRNASQPTKGETASHGARQGNDKVVPGVPEKRQATLEEMQAESQRLASQSNEFENEILALLKTAKKIKKDIALLTEDGTENTDDTNNNRSSATGRKTETLEETLTTRITKRRNVISVNGSGYQLARTQLEHKKLKSDVELARQFVQELTERIETLEKWTRVSFSLVNGKVSIVGVRHDVAADSFKVVAKATGADAVEGLQVIRNSGIPRIDRDRALSRDIFLETTLNKTVAADLDKRIRKYWQPYTFLKQASDTDELKFVQFRELTSGNFQFGVFIGFDENKLLYQPVGRKPIGIAREYVDRETAMIVNGEAIVPHLSAPDFVDYCVLSVASKLSTRAKERLPKESEENKTEAKKAALSQYIRVAIHVDVDAFRDDLAIYHRATTQKGRSQKKKSTPSIRLSINRVHNFANFLTHMSNWSKSDAERFLLNTVKDPELRKAASFIEDELYARLVRIGVPVLEREELTAIVQERNLFRSPTEIRRHAGLANATHLLLVELKPSQSGNATYHLSVRLDDVDNGIVEWAGQGDRFANRSEVGRQFQMSKGRLALIFMSTSRRKKVPKGRTDNNAGGRNVFLGYVEPGERATEWSIRNIDGNTPFRVSKASVRRIQYIESGTDIPQHLSLGYALNRIRSELLPPGGHVVSVDKNVAILEMGRRQGVRRGDQFYLVRPSPPTDSSKGGFRSHLSTRLSAVEVSEDQTRAVVSTNGFEQWWQTATIRKKDIAIVRRKASLSIGVGDFRLVDPDVKVLTALNFRNPTVRNTRIQQTVQAAAKLAAQIENDLLANRFSIATASDPIPVGEDPKTPTSRYTHSVRGTITLSPLMAIGMGNAIKPVFRVNLTIREADSERKVRRIVFDWDGQAN